MNASRVCVALVVSVTTILMAASSGWSDSDEKPTEKPKTDVFAGTIRTLDIEKRVMTVETTPINKTFGIASDCEVMAKDKPKASLGDLAVGNVVSVTYQEEAGGMLVAHRIELKGPPQETGTEEKTGSTRYPRRSGLIVKMW